MRKLKNELAQAVRRSHCAHDDQENPDHICVGSCKITPTGIELECPLCGPDQESQLHPASKKAWARVRALVKSAGIDWESLSMDAQNSALRVALEEYCPYCGIMAPLGAKFFNCPCGARLVAFHSRVPEWKREGADNG